MIPGGRETHLVVHLGGDYAPGLQTRGNVKLLGHVLDAAPDLEGEHGGGEATAVAEKTNTLSLQALVVDTGENAGQAAVDTSAVHVTALCGHVDAGLYAGGKPLLRQRHEGLLNRLVRDGSGVVHALQLGGNFREDRVGWVLEIIVVEQASVRFRDELAGGGVEGHVVEAVDRRLLLLAVAIDAVAVLLRLERLLARVIGLVAGVDSLGVAADGEVAVNNGVLARQIRLVEIVRVSDVRAALASLDGEGRIGADEHSDAAGASSRARIALLVQRNVARHDNRVTAVPRRGLDPVDAVEERVRAAVAGVDRVHALDVVVARLVEQLHQHRLDRLGLVEHGLGADLEAANRLGVDVVLFEQRRE
jgi:hypothetical protein